MPTPDEMSHAVLIGVLMSMGGEAVIPGEYLTDPDVTGTPDGTLHALELQPLPGGRLRVRVVPRPPDAGDDAAIAIGDPEP